MLRFLGYLPKEPEPFDVEHVVSSDHADVAVLQLRPRRAQDPAAGTGRSPPRPGAEVVVLGYPTGMHALMARAEPVFVEELLAGGELNFWELARGAGRQWLHRSAGHRRRRRAGHLGLGGLRRRDDPRRKRRPGARPGGQGGGGQRRSRPGVRRIQPGSSREPRRSLAGPPRRRIQPRRRLTNPGISTDATPVGHGPGGESTAVTTTNGTEIAITPPPGGYRGGSPCAAPPSLFATRSTCRAFLRYRACSTPSSGNGGRGDAKAVTRKPNSMFVAPPRRLSC